MASNNPGLLDELRRRNVFRVGLVYLASSWLILQVLDVVGDIVTLPEGLPRWTLLILAAAFVPTLIAAWLFEVTPKGISKTRTVERGASITGQTGRFLDRLIIGVLGVAVVALVVDRFVTAPAPEQEQGASAASFDSIAVLPFEDVSEGADNSFFSDGLADTLLHTLAQVQDLRVAARASSFQFRNSDLAPAEIGNRLNVEALLGGSVQRAGNAVRVTAQLVDMSGENLWSGQFDRQLDDIFQIQDEIALQVVTALEVEMRTASGTPLSLAEPRNIDAYTQLLLAQQQLEAFSFSSLPAAVQHLEQALALDPNYALAHATLSKTYLEMQNIGAMNSDEALRKARAAALKAVELDGSLSLAYVALGRIESIQEETELAEEYFERAIKLEPSSATALEDYARHKRFTRDAESALLLLDRALEINRLSVGTYAERFHTFMALNRFSDALATAGQIRELVPDAPAGYYLPALAYLDQDEYAEAAPWLERASKVDPDDPEILVFLGDSYLGMDLVDQAGDAYRRALDVSDPNPMAESAMMILNRYEYPGKKAANRELALSLLNSPGDNRLSSRDVAIRVLIEHGIDSGDFSEARFWAEKEYPSFFADPPVMDQGRWNGLMIGDLLIRAGEVDRGRFLVAEALQKERNRRTDPNLFVVQALVVLDELDEAVDVLEQLKGQDGTGGLWRYNVEFQHRLDPIRGSAAYERFVGRLRDHAEKQAQQWMDKYAPGDTGDSKPTDRSVVQHLGAGPNARKSA